MNLNINGKDIELVYSFRSTIYFEQIAGKNVDFQNFTGNDLITLFYTVVIASMQKAKEPIISMIDFLDVVDDNGGDKCLLDFSNWYANIMKGQWDAYESTLSEEDKKESKKVSSKKKKN